MDAKNLTGVYRSVEILRCFRKWCSKSGRKYVNIPGISVSELNGAILTAETALMTVARMYALSSRIVKHETESK